MTALELNAELYRAMGEIADDETLLAKVVKYVKKLAAQKKTDPTLMTKEEFFARVDKAEKEIADGKGFTFTNRDDMNVWLNSL
ncbi:MAG: hypothetical protein K6B13_11475 [Prevotella sp.]|jgi:hypothetical protein|nr:hypothetical protein [Prevotella sp.]